MPSAALPPRPGAMYLAAYRIGRQRRRARRRHPVMRGLLKRVRITDQLWLAERRSRERDTVRLELWDESRRERLSRWHRQRRVVGHEPTRNDDAWIAGARGNVRATVRREQDRVEVAVHDIETVGPRQQQVLSTIRLITKRIRTAGRRVHHV